MKPGQITPHKIIYDLNKKKVSSVIGPNEPKLNMEIAADHLDDYFTKGICKPLGLGTLIALFELVPAALLIKFINSPATKTNFFTSFGELLQVVISGTRLFGNPKIDKVEFRKLSKEKQNSIIEKAKSAKERREGIMALIQTGAGVSGLASLGLEIFRGENSKDVEDLSGGKRTALSLASFTSALLMLSGYFEKNLIAGIASKLPGTTENNMMNMNGNSDGRCFIEWMAMTILPWCPWLPKIVKTTIDTLIPLFAIKEGVSQLVSNGHIPTIISSKKIELPKKMLDILKKIPFLIDKEEGSNIPKLAATNFFLEKIRHKFFLPALRFFKTNPPEFHLNGKDLICEFASQSLPNLQNSKQRELSLPSFSTNGAYTTNSQKELVAVLS